MANKKASKKAKLNKQYKKRAKLLKKHKLINYDLRSNLSPQQKAAITRLWKGKKDSDNDGHHSGWGQYIDNDNVTFRTVSNKRIKQLKEQGYKTHGNRVYIDKEGFDSIHIKHDSIIKRRADKEQRDYLIANHDIFEKLESLTKRKLPPGQFVTVRIGDNGMFRREVLTSYESLLNYLSKWSPDKDYKSKDDLINQMSIVKFTGDFNEI